MPFSPNAGHVRGDNQAVWLQLPDQQTRIDYPKVFRKPFVFTHFGGDVVAWPDAEGWRLRSHRFDLVGDGFAATLHGGADMQGDGTRPALDVYAQITDGTVDAAKLFWPVNVMPPATVEWLDRALDGNARRPAVQHRVPRLVGNLGQAARLAAGI